MQGSSDEISHSIELTPPTIYDFSTLPAEHCFYCGIHNEDSIVKCETCLNWYCTDPIPSGSHFSWHLTLRNHSAWSSHPRNRLHGGLFCCATCRISNIVMLCAVNGRILCRHHAIREKDSNSSIVVEELISNGRPSAAVFGESTAEEQSHKRVLNKKHIKKLENNLKMGKNPLEGLEDLPEFAPPMTKIKLRYESIEEYIDMYRKLLFKDMEFNKENAQTHSIPNLSISFARQSGSKSLIGSFSYNRLETGIKLTLGSPIHVLRSVNGKDVEVCDAVVSLINSRKGTVKMQVTSNAKEIESRDDYSVKIQFIPIPHERMLEGLEKLNSGCIGRSLKKFIIGKQMIADSSGFQNSRIRQVINDVPVPNLAALNESQREAVKKALSVNISIIQGPPGTGKTHSAAVTVFKLFHLLKKSQKILVTSNSNIAVDNLVERIHQTGLRVVKVASRLREKINSGSDIVQANSLHTLLRQNIAANHPEIIDLFDYKYEYYETLEPKQYATLMKSVRPAEKDILKSMDVICCTNIVSADDRLSDFNFPYVLIDEANQSIEPETLLPLLKNCKQLVLVGDQMQLGPMTKCSATQSAGLPRSLMTRLIHLGVQPILLNYQYRMHPTISNFPGRFFYEGQIRNGVTEDDRPVINNFWPNNVPNLFIHNEFAEASSGANSVSNLNEAFEVLEVIAKLRERMVELRQIVVLTPYEAQKRVIIEMCEMRNVDVPVMNIDEFQGNEADYVIFSTVRSNVDNNIGFLNDFRRMNVAITRAKFGMVILGNCKSLGMSKLWCHLVKHYSEERMIYEGNFGRLRLCTHVPPISQPFNFGDQFPYSDQVVPTPASK